MTKRMDTRVVVAAEADFGSRASMENKESGWSCVRY